MEWLDYPAIQLRIGGNGCFRQRTVRRFSLLYLPHCQPLMHRFTLGKPYWVVPFAIFFGLFVPIPFWLVHHYSPKGSLISRIAAYINPPIVALYVGWLPYSVNGQWWYVGDVNNCESISSHAAQPTGPASSSVSRPSGGHVLAVPGGSSPAIICCRLHWTVDPKSSCLFWYVT